MTSCTVKVSKIMLRQCNSRGCFIEVSRIHVNRLGSTMLQVFMLHSQVT